MEEKKADLTFEDWLESLKGLDFDSYSVAMRDKILEGNLDELSKKCFNDCFDYVHKLYKQNKPLEASLLKIYLEQVKGYENIKVSEFITILLLLSYCGFTIKTIK